MTPRQIKITEKVLSFIDWLETQNMLNKAVAYEDFDEVIKFIVLLGEKLIEIKLESFAAEQLEEEDYPGQDLEESYYDGFEAGLNLAASLCSNEEEKQMILDCKGK